MALSNEDKLKLMCDGLGLDWARVSPNVLRYGEPLVEIAKMFRTRGNSPPEVQLVLETVRDLLPAARLLIQIEDSLPPG